MIGSIFNFSRALSLVALVAMVCCLSSTTASGSSHPTITLVDDRFDDGGFTNGADPLDTEWYGFRATTDGDAGGPYGVQNDDGVGTDFINGGNAFFIDRNSSNAPTGATADLPGATGGAGHVGTGNNGNGMATPNLRWRLVNPGDFISLSFDYRLLGTIETDSGGLRFGFGNRTGTGDTTAFPTGQFDDQAFWVRVATGTNADWSLRQEFGGQATVFDGGDTISGGTATRTNLDDNNELSHAMLTVTKLASGDFQLDASLGVGVVDTLSAVFDAGFGFGLPPLDSFDFFGVTARDQSDLIIDNVLVTTNGTQVPEPASLALLTLGMAATAVGRRRRR